MNSPITITSDFPIINPYEFIRNAGQTLTNTELTVSDAPKGNTQE